MTVRKRIRDAISGRFLQAYEAMPDTSVTETVKPDLVPQYRWDIDRLTVALIQAGSDLRKAGYKADAERFETLAHETRIKWEF